MNKIKTFDVVLNFICILIAIILLLPFYNVIIRSFATSAAIAQQPMYLMPTVWDFSSYKMIFAGGDAIRAFMNSVFVTIVGTLLGMTITVMGAYGLSRKTLPGRKLIMILIIFTMFFQGGLIPYYLNIRSLGLINNIWVLILPSAVYTFQLIIMVNYFKGLPESLLESARIDGANHMVMLFRIALPISKPMIAALSLTAGVMKWNAWWDALYFISDHDKYPMQLFLREMLVDVTMFTSSSQGADIAQSMQDVSPESLKMATVIVTMIPIMLVYPFLQRYFTKGAMVGAIKG